MVTGGVDTGWTFYTPFSTTYSNTHVIGAAIGIFIAGFSSIFTGLNFIVTIHRMRAPGLTWRRLPLFCWSNYAASTHHGAGHAGHRHHAPAGRPGARFPYWRVQPALGGDPLLFQHLFWFYSHPAVYIMILPGMGVISEIVTCFSRKRVFGYEFVALASIAIAVLGFLVWAHHMFVAGISVYAALVFSLLSYLVAIPSAVKIFNWTATMYKGSIRYDTPMLYAFGFIGLFTIGGLTGVFLASLGLDVHVTRHLFHRCALPLRDGGRHGDGLHGGTALLVAQDQRANVSRGVGEVVGAAGVRRIQHRPSSRSSFWATWDVPRRYHAYPPEFQVLNVLSTAGASILAVGYVLPMIYFMWSLRYGELAPTESVERGWAGVDDAVAAADAQLRRDASRDLGSLRLRASAARGGHRWPLAIWTSRSLSTRCSTTLPTWSSSRRPPPSACGCSC